MGVVLPGEPDAAVHLDIEVGALVARGECQRSGDGGGVGELIGALARGAGRVPHGAGRQLGGHEHVGAVVLDGLERRDGPTELHAHLGVGGGLLGAFGGDAGRLRRHNQSGEVDERPPPAGDHLGRCSRRA